MLLDQHGSALLELFGPEVSRGFYCMVVAQQEMQSLLQQALSAQQSGNMAAAEQACRQVLAINADEPNALQFLGLIHRQKGDGTEAERLMRRSLAVAPNQPHVLNNLGNLFSSQGRHEDAVEAYTGAVALNGDYQEAWRNLGLVQTTMGLLKEARTSLGTALKHAPRRRSQLERAGHRA